MAYIEKFAIDVAPVTYAVTVDELSRQVGTECLRRQSDVAEILGHVAEGFRRVGQTSRAYELFLRSFHLWRRLGVPNRMCWCLWGIGSVLRGLGRLDESLSWFEHSLSLAASSGEAVYLMNTGDIVKAESVLHGIEVSRLPIKDKANHRLVAARLASFTGRGGRVPKYRSVLKTYGALGMCHGFVSAATLAGMACVPSEWVNRVLSQAKVIATRRRYQPEQAALKDLAIGRISSYAINLY